MISFTIETLNSGTNLSFSTSFKKFDVAIATIKNLLKMAVWKKHLNKTEMEKVD